MALAKPQPITDRASLDAELSRIADICHGCRRCFSLCPSFDVLFKGLDVPEVDGEVEKLPKRVLQDFVDLCYECRLCIPHCPYVPPHRWQVHVPHMVLHARRLNVADEGVPLRDRMLSSPDELGRLATTVAPLANLATRLPVLRWGMEKTLGVARQKTLPVFASQTFTRWFETRDVPKSTGRSVAKVVFFPTCSVQWNRVDIGKAAVQVLERNGVEVVVDYPRCCGMPFFDVGDFASANEARREVTAALKVWMDKGYTVVTPGPSCSLMMKREYNWLGPDPRGGAELAVEARDLGEFLMELKAQGKLDTRFPNAPASIAYHLPCHLKVQNIGYKSRDLLLLTGAPVTMVERCSGHDGTWSMKVEYFEESMKVGRKLFDLLDESRAEVLASDCPLAALQIAQGMSRPVKHPVEIVRDAYGMEAP